MYILDEKVTAYVSGVPSGSTCTAYESGPTTLLTADATSKDELTTVTTRHEDNGESGGNNMDFECNNAGSVEGNSDAWILFRRVLLQFKYLVNALSSYNYNNMICVYSQ